MKLKRHFSQLHIDDLIEKMSIRNAKTLTKGKIDGIPMEDIFSKQEELFGEFECAPLLNQNKKQISVSGIVEI
jgi:hypothetical protein